jgi:hypothetical protein
MNILKAKLIDLVLVAGQPRLCLFTISQSDLEGTPLMSQPLSPSASSVIISIVFTPSSIIPTVEVVMGSWKVISSGQEKTDTLMYDPINPIEIPEEIMQAMILVSSHMMKNGIDSLGHLSLRK